LQPGDLVIRNATDAVRPNSSVRVQDAPVTEPGTGVPVHH
jgi:hypothetical protein